MVVNNFHIQSIDAIPAKTDSPSVVDANAPLSGSVSFEQFQAIPGRHPEEVQSGRSMQLDQFSFGNSTYC